MRNLRPSVLLFVVMIVTIVTTVSPVNAQGKYGLDFMAGGGVYRDNVYAGSNDFYVVPVPIAHASYGTEDFSFYLSILDGLGISWSSEEAGITGSVSVRYGEERDSEEYSLLGIMKDHSDRTKRLLAGTPTASAPSVYDLTVSYRAPKGMIEASVVLYPTSLDYKLSGQEDRDYHGVLSSLYYSVEGPVAQNLLLSARVGIEYMNQGYADAWYSVRYPTTELESLQADAGLRDAKFSVQVTRMFSEKAGLSLLTEGTVLAGDAGKSPYTVEKFQPSTLLFAFYNF